MHPSLAYLPSPRNGVWNLGPIPIRAYALCIIAGIVAAVWIGERRWVARGGRRGTVSDVAVWAVVFGLVGGRLYHVITDPELYFGAGRHPLDIFKVWQGGLGIWGAISVGGVGAWIGCRRRGIKLPPYADAVAPGIAVAQAIGRWGNWFNQELFGKPTTLPWGLKIDPGRPNTVPGAVAYHPTFLYESLWDLALAGVLVLVDRRFTMGRGRVFALYVMGYTAGRVWIEALRIDTANHILGLRVNIWVSILVFAGGLIYFLRHPGPRETVVEPAAATTAEATEAAAASATDEPAEAEPGAEVVTAESAAGPESRAESEPAEPEPEPTGSTVDAESRAESEPAEPVGSTADAESPAESEPEPAQPAAATASDVSASDTSASETTPPGAAPSDPAQPAGDASDHTDADDVARGTAEPAASGGTRPGVTSNRGDKS